jgi:type I restriction enzyme, S subunit
MSEMLLQHFDLLATAPGGAARLRELILTLAVQGKLVPQDPTDEPASVLLQRIRVEKDRLIAEGKIKRDKPLPPITDEEKWFALPEGWEWSTLAQVGVINPRNDAPDDMVASFVQMSSIPVAFSDQHSVEPRPWREIKSSFTQFAEGDVGVAKITPCFENGKSTVFQNLSNGIGAGTTELHIVRPLGGVLPRYVLLFLKTPGFLKDGEAVMTGSAGQKRLPRAYFENKPFPLPPVHEQSRIVARVEELMRLCDTLEAKGQLDATQHAQLLHTLLGTLTDSTTPEELAAHWQRVAAHFDLLLDRPEAVDALEQTILQLAVRGLLVPQDPNDEPASVLLQRIRVEKDRLIAEGKIKRDKPLPPVTDEEKPFELPQGWEWARLCSIANFIDYRGKTPTKTEAGVPLITAKNVRQGFINREPREFIAESAYDGWMTRGFPRVGDLLFTTEAPLGNIAAIDIHERFVLAQRVICFGMYELGMSGALCAFMQSPWMQDALARQASGVTAQGIKSARLQLMPIPVPPLAEQSRIVDRVEEIHQLCNDLRQRLGESRTIESHLAEALLMTAE